MTGTDASRQSPARAAAAAASRARWGNLVWLLPVLTLYAAGLLLPLGITVQRALELGVTGWSELLRNSLFTGAALNTAIDSAEITVVAVLLAYSLAAAIWRGGPITRAVLTTLV